MQAGRSSITFSQLSNVAILIMTTSNTQLRNEYDDFTTTSRSVTGLPEPTTRSTPNVVRFPEPPAPDVPEGYTSINSLAEKFARTEKGREALKHGRKWVADQFYADDGITIKTLRLRKGWSQVDLADYLETSQSHVSRLEKGGEDVRFSTLKKLCAALEQDMNTISAAIDRQLVKRPASTE